MKEECFMNLKFAFTALCCKALSFAAQKLGGGTDRPGSIALRDTNDFLTDKLYEHMAIKCRCEVILPLYIYLFTLNGNGTMQLCRCRFRYKRDF